MPDISIKIKYLLRFSLIGILGVYSIYFPLNKTVVLFLDQYIIFLAILFLSFLSYYFKQKLKDFHILYFIANMDRVSLRSAVLFFLFFEIIDYYFEDGFEGMITLWITYWCFALLAYLLTININLYKNLRFYKNS